MQVRAVDPRSTKWELDNPVFYVSFFRHDSTRIHVPSESVSYESEEWELTGGDVQDALAWAKNHAGQDRSWTLHVAGLSPEGVRFDPVGGHRPECCQRTDHRLVKSSGQTRRRIAA